LNVWLLTTSEPTDLSGTRLMRTGMLGKYLALRGHSVDWWTAAFDHHSKAYVAARTETKSINPDYRVHFLHTRVVYRRNISALRLLNHQRVASEFLRRANAAPRPDVIVCSYPTMDMGAAAIRYAAPRSVPVVLDVRDLWPDIFSSAFPDALRKLRLDAAILAPLNRRKRRIFAAAAAIVATSPKYLDWAIRSVPGGYRGSTDVFPLAYPRLAGIDEARAASQATRKELGFDADDIVVWFVGSFGRTYDLGPALVAARESASCDRRLRFVFSGEGEMGASWQALARDLSNVTFTGWLEQAELVRIAGIADIGLLAYRSGAPQGLPNKLFEYMALGIPVVSSLDGECRDFIEAEGIGLSYSAHVDHDLSTVLLDLAADAERRRAMGMLARRAYSERFDSAVVYDKFVDYIEHVASGPVEP
jgi:glycosyltransferase involved in cell wall biosynthesis